MTTKYEIVIDDEGHSVISIVAEGEAITIQHDHPNFTRILEAALHGGDVSRLLSISRAIAEMDERVVVRGNTIFFDGEEVENALTRTILRFQAEGRDSAGLVRFMERLAENPSRRARETLFAWVQDRDLTVTEDGCFIGWKAVGDDMLSVQSGEAYVDGVLHTGQIPNRVGAVVSMPRTEVMDDPNAQCSVGLHVGTYNYARGFAQVLLEVKVAPEDVVSVPAGDASWKIRCCEYEVLKIHEGVRATEERADVFDQDYEAEAFAGDDPGLEPLEPVVPETFLARLRRAMGRG